MPAVRHQVRYRRGRKKNRFTTRKKATLNFPNYSLAEVDCLALNSRTHLENGITRAFGAIDDKSIPQFVLQIHHTFATVLLRRRRERKGCSRAWHWLGFDCCLTAVGLLSAKMDGWLEPHTTQLASPVNSGGHLYGALHQIFYQLVEASHILKPNEAYCLPLLPADRKTSVTNGFPCEAVPPPRNDAWWDQRHIIQCRRVIFTMVQNCRFFFISSAKAAKINLKFNSHFINK